MRPQYCSCGQQCIGNRPQLRCESKSHATIASLPQHNDNYRIKTTFLPQPTAMGNFHSQFNIIVKLKLKNQNIYDERIESEGNLTFM